MKLTAAWSQEWNKLKKGVLVIASSRSVLHSFPSPTYQLWHLHSGFADVNKHRAVNKQGRALSCDSIKVIPLHIYNSQLNMKTHIQLTTQYDNTYTIQDSTFYTIIYIISLCGQYSQEKLLWDQLNQSFHELH